MYGWSGKILEIDLSSQKVKLIELSQEIYQEYIGGRGLAGYFLAPSISLSWDNPAMPLILMTGPLVNTSSPTSGRTCIMSKSPLTTTVGDSSVGGKLGTELKKAGLDGIILIGKRGVWSGLEIYDGHVQIKEAENLQGSSTQEVFNILHSKASTVAIGPAAENRVRFANISVDGHFFAGRNGLGLIMASKKLKYITIQGTGQTKVNNLSSLKKARQDIDRLIAASPVLFGKYGLKNFGTGCLYDLMDARLMMPTDNFKQTCFTKARSMNACAIERNYSPKKEGCRGCHIQCKRLAKDGRAIPEFESMSHLSALIGNKNLETVMEANRLCSDLGMDTISTGASLACYAEITQKSLSSEDILGLIKDIAWRRGEGKLLGLGSAKYAREKGHPEISMSVKGLDLPAYDPRGSYGMALAYATSNRGGCHLRAYPISHEILRKPVATDRFSFEGKARIIKIAEDTLAIVDSLIACKFVFLSASLEEFSRAYNAVTGSKVTAQELLKTGEKIYYRERMMNAENGFTAKDDDLPRRFFLEPGTKGQSLEIPPLNREAFLQARANYYRIRGLTQEGLPRKDQAKELGIDSESFSSWE